MKIDTTASKANFAIKKLLFITVKGTLPQVNGEISVDTSNSSASKIDLNIALSGLDTGNKKRNEHLLQADFFNAAKHPKIKFRSTDIEKKKDNLCAKGEMSISGTTKIMEVPLQMKDSKILG